MPFAYATGVTANPADPVLGWFQAFQAFITSRINWFVLSGGGTKDLVIFTRGEKGAYQNCYARVWESAANTISFEVRNAAGTQITAELGTLLNATGLDFTYHIAGDEEAITFAIKTSAGIWSWGYIGTVMPFALVPPDETYTMIACSTPSLASVLRYHDGTWDVDINLYEVQVAGSAGVDPLNGSYPLYGLLADRQRLCVGQLRHVSSEVFDPAIAEDDTMDTLARSGQTTTWIIVSDAGAKIAMRTGGEVPSGIPDGSMSHLSTNLGVANPGSSNWTQFFGVTLPAFMVSAGWVDLGAPGIWSDDRLFYSTGLSGQDDIFVAIGWDNPTTNINIRVQNNALGTQATTPSTMNASDESRGAPIYVSCDRDCLALTFKSDDVGTHDLLWGGKCTPGIGDAADGTYFMGTTTGGTGRVLRTHDNVWNAAAFIVDGTGNALIDDSSPNAIDGRTNLLWPIGLAHTAGGRIVLTGGMKFIYRVSGALNTGDLINIAGKQYRISSRGSAGWAFRVS